MTTAFDAFERATWRMELLALGALDGELAARRREREHESQDAWNALSATQQRIVTIIAAFGELVEVWDRAAASADYAIVLTAAPGITFLRNVIVECAMYRGENRAIVDTYNARSAAVRAERCAALRTWMDGQRTAAFAEMRATVRAGEKVQG